MDEAWFDQWERLANAAVDSGHSVVLTPFDLQALLCEIRHGTLPDDGAPRHDADGSPCWCNGPYARNEDHHSWCRGRRKAWRKFLRVLGRPHPLEESKAHGIPVCACEEDRRDGLERRGMVLPRAARKNANAMGGRRAGDE